MYFFYSSADIVIVQTTSMKQTLLAEVNSAKKWNLLVLNNPIEMQKMDYNGAQEPALKINQPYFMAAGRLIPEKGFDLLIKAFISIPDPYQLYIAGSGPCESELQSLIETNQMQHRIHLCGQVENPIPLFKNAFACIISSRIEGFPNTLLQMMSQCGRVASTICTDEISSIPTIYTCPTHSEKELQDALQQLIQIDAELAMQKHKQQRLYLQSYHTFDHYFQLL